MRRFLAAVVICGCATIAQAGDITGIVSDLEGDPFVLRNFSATVTARNGRTLPVNATSNQVPDPKDATKKLNQFQVTFNSSDVSPKDKLVNVTLNATGREPVFLLGLDGTAAAPFKIDIIMPETHLKAPSKVCPPAYPSTARSASTPVSNQLASPSGVVDNPRR